MEGSVDAAVYALQAAIADVPDRISTPQQLQVRGLVATAMARLARRLGADTRPDIAACFLTLTASTGTESRWRQDVLDVVERCGATLRLLPRPPQCCSLHVREVLRLLDDRFHDPYLTLPKLTGHVRLSRSHVCRLLKQQTGRSFLEHLHERRVAAAHALLTESRMTIKEVAAAVGYTSAKELRRHCTRRYGVPPTSVRPSEMA